MQAVHSRSYLLQRKYGEGKEGVFRTDKVVVLEEKIGDGASTVSVVYVRLNTKD
jgi:hypothetical protein